MGPDGAAIGHWRIRFADGRFEWFRSDVSVSGVYACEDGRLTGHWGDRRLEGVYRLETDRLVWEGEPY